MHRARASGRLPTPSPSPSGILVAVPLRLALALLALASVAIPVVSFVDAVWAQWTFALLALGFPVALMAVGAARGGRVGWLGGVFVGLLALLVASGVAILSGAGAESRIGDWLGLPASFVAFALGVWLLPFVLTIAAYARAFDRFGISTDDLDRLRRTAGPRVDE
jgi:hypothetical protein